MGYVRQCERKSLSLFASLSLLVFFFLSFLLVITFRSPSESLRPERYDRHSTRVWESVWVPTQTHRRTVTQLAEWKVGNRVETINKSDYGESSNEQRRETSLVFVFVVVVAVVSIAVKDSHSPLRERERERESTQSPLTSHFLSFFLFTFVNSRSSAKTCVRLLLRQRIKGGGNI